MTTPDREQALGGWQTIDTPLMPTVTLSPDALVTIAGGETVTWAECQRRLLAAAAPAPVSTNEVRDE